LRNFIAFLGREMSLCRTRQTDRVSSKLPRGD